MLAYALFGGRFNAVVSRNLHLKYGHMHIFYSIIVPPLI